MSFRLRARGRVISFPRRPLLMGIVNINDDSFSGDGRIDASWALERARELTAQGADIIDVGAESARTNRDPIGVREEIARLEPFLHGFAEAVAKCSPRDNAQLFPPLLSINTWRTEVAEATLCIAGDILNDMGGLPDHRNARHCARHGAALLIMHTVGAPKEKHTHVTYPDVMDVVTRFFLEKLTLAREAGMDTEATILDPGFDFAKQGHDNLVLLARCGEWRSLQRPILLPISRKSFIGRTLGISDPAARDAATSACLVAGFHRGAHLFRLHNIEMGWQVLNALSKTRDAAGA